ncbi:MAG: DUF1289 domain-containing protein [Armatimonadetes bacterium]|nr:DUF1289 domain-containing protein [Armatimonadota bacterium]
MAKSRRRWQQLMLPCPSPCQKRCGVDETLRCSGCFRYGREIAEWRDMSDEQRWAIVFQLPARRASA